MTSSDNTIGLHVNSIAGDVFDRMCHTKSRNPQTFAGLTDGVPNG